MVEGGYKKGREVRPSMTTTGRAVSSMSVLTDLYKEVPPLSYLGRVDLILVVSLCSWTVFNLFCKVSW